jgi:putative ABC transport system substrate-binding protein
MSTRVHLIRLIVLLALSIFVVPRTSDTQQMAQVPRIGVLSPGPPPPVPDPNLDAFRQGLHDLGYVEGQTIRLEYRYADWQPERLPTLAAELVQRHPDVLFTFTTPGVLAAKQATATIPIVVGAAGDLVARGLVESLAHPGGNITGMTSFGPELEGKCLERLKEAAPQITRVAVLVNPANPAFARRPVDLAAEAQTLGVRLQRVEARDPSEFEGAFAAIAASRADALLVGNEAVFHAHRHRIVALATTHRLPAISGIPEFAEAGGLMQCGASPIEMVRHAATHVAKILKGAKPGELPVERPMKLELVINLKTAKELGLTIPPAVLFQAEEVIR